MRKYTRPVIKLQVLSIQNIASLSSWLTKNNLTEAGITTYYINS